MLAPAEALTVCRMSHVTVSVRSFPRNTPWALRWGEGVHQRRPGGAAGMGRLTRPPHDASASCPADPVNGASLGKRVFADVTKLGIARWDGPRFKVGPTPSKYPYEKRERRHDGDGHTKTERCSRRPRKPWSHRHMAGASKRPPRAFRAHGSDDTLISDFWDTASKHAAPPSTSIWDLRVPRERTNGATCAMSQPRPTEL